jgi:PKD repeat protein
MNKKVFVILIVLSFAFVKLSFAQKHTLEGTNYEELVRLAKIYEESYFSNRIKAVSEAQKRGLPLIIQTKDGQAYLESITEAGDLLYLKSDNNTTAAQTTAADKIQAGGGMGLYLTGKGMKVGVWEVGVPNLNHQELINKVSQIDGGVGGQSGSDPTNHATHVLGTIVAKGINPISKGMAFEAIGDSYTSSNDNTEMANAANTGLLISNHSYGFLRGWSGTGTNRVWNGNQTISPNEDYLFGFYDSQAREWDQIAFNAPFYLICKSAGNERGDTGTQTGITAADGNGGTGYDCISHGGISKNVLTVGAVQSVTNYSGPNSVIMSSFSSWGPTDDGRIKPDLVAQGVAVVSSAGANNDSYLSLQGTSMSAPNVAGSLLLLQELYRDLNNGNFMRSATLKGLAIHTTREAGSDPGPDYSFGWGLLNVENAANVLLKRDNQGYFVEELTLNNNQAIEKTFTVDGSAPIIATICWTDPAGVPEAVSLDPSKLMLVNDLDMRITGSDNTTFFPWRLDPALPNTDSPNAAATKGDNFRDNVEKIEILTPAAGTYTLKITHKNTLAGNNPQRVSLILTTKTIQNQRKTLYWVGGNGNWNDATKWSLTSGGAGANQTPTVEDVVIFDDKSFSVNGQTVAITPNATCFSLGWFSDKQANISSNGNILTVNGSFYRRNNTLSFSNEANIKFTGTSSKLNNIIVENPELLNTNLVIDANDATQIWNLKNSLKTKSISLSGGNLNVSNNLSVNELNISSSKPKVLNIKDLTIDSLTNLQISGTNLTINSTNSTFKFNGKVSNNQTRTFNASGIFNNIELNEGKLEISGNNTFNTLTATGELSINGNNTLSNLILAKNSTLNLAPNTTQIISKDLKLNAENANPITIKTTGGTSTLSSNNTRRFCYNFLNIENVKTTGQTKFVAGANSTITNSDGWIKANCNDLIYADFKAAFTCAGGVTEFSNLSTGNPTQNQWNFNVAAGNTNTSTLTNPTFVYNTVGDYQVNLAVANGTGNDSFTQTISVKNSTSISKPTITYNEVDKALRSSVVAQNYQWYLNDTPIAGADKFFYLTSDPGSYVVEISNTECKFRSEPFVITSLEEQSQFLFNTTTIGPNPVQGSFELKIQNQYLGKLDIELSNLLGNPIAKYSEEKMEETFKKSFNTTRLSPGVYLMRLRIAGVQASKKIIVY